jgi:hypothetical protein
MTLSLRFDGRHFLAEQADLRKTFHSGITGKPLIGNPVLSKRSRHD